VTPRATYRLQFRREFGFAGAIALAPYLAGLGVSHVYASPIATARAGSAHGYDVVDPTVINPELGGETGFRALVAALRQHGLGVILDIVPNHLAVGGADNRWWLDVLEKGEDSPHASLFDIDWRPADPALHGKVLAPFLGAPYAEALARGDIRLSLEGGGLAAMAHGTHRFPIRAADREGVLAEGLARFDPDHPEGRLRLHALLERQAYRLAWWRTAGDEINWRRFFDIIELAGVRAECDEGFDLIHALPLRLYAEGLIDGVRADHVDGLADPAAYCRGLRAALSARQAGRPADVPGGPAWFVVEKILGPGERLARDWGVDGTTGYDFMDDVAGLLHDPRGAGALGELWAKVSWRGADFGPEAIAARGEILDRAFSGQLDGAARAFHALAVSDIATRDVTQDALRRALKALLIVFPVYRTYANGLEIPADSRAIVRSAADRAKRLAPTEGPTLDHLSGWLSAVAPGDRWSDAVRRFQQLSAPVAAKAVEDTAFYRYGRLLSRNDVGFDPAAFSLPAEQFHAKAADRRAHLPGAMLATATHDHKRGEDVRARLAVLGEIPELWREAVTDWRGLNAKLGLAIDPADEYMLYQTLVGAWPMDLAPDDAAGLGAFADRVAGWQEKALREAKLRSSWTEPAAYEAICARFLKGALDPGRSPAFLAALAAFVDRIAPAGALNSLTQTLLRCTSPGVPDLYQGAEFWDLSLVDPDNRRPVDYQARREALAAGDDPRRLLETWRDGRVKQGLIHRVLAVRQALPALFAHGDYRAVEVHGPRDSSALAFVRRHGGARLFVAAPLHCARAVLGREAPLAPSAWWGDTAFSMPGDHAPADWRDMLAPDLVPAAPGLLARDLFSRFPVAMLVDAPHLGQTVQP
jgi:(1->4)-alpha-D-glucan 1-alpha-D-glucosylmutase